MVQKSGTFLIFYRYRGIFPVNIGILWAEVEQNAYLAKAYKEKVGVYSTLSEELTAGHPAKDPEPLRKSLNESQWGGSATD